MKAMKRNSDLSRAYKSHKPKGATKEIEGNKLKTVTTIGKLGKSAKIVRLSQKNESLHNFMSNCITNEGTINKLEQRDVLTAKFQALNLEKRNYYNKRKLKKRCK